MCVAGKGHPPRALPGLVDGEREEAREQRQKQIFNLSHLLGGDPEEAPLHGLQEELKRKLTHTNKHYLHFPKIFSDNRPYSGSHITLYVRSGSLWKIKPFEEQFHSFSSVLFFKLKEQSSADKTLYPYGLLHQLSLCCHTVCIRGGFVSADIVHHKVEEVMTGWQKPM